jgi:hypothetical protein
LLDREQFQAAKKVCALWCCMRSATISRKRSTRSPAAQAYPKLVGGIELLKRRTRNGPQSRKSRDKRREEVAQLAEQNEELTRRVQVLEAQLQLVTTECDLLKLKAATLPAL